MEFYVEKKIVSKYDNSFIESLQIKERSKIWFKEIF